jgi:hypothetical protein
MRQRVRDQSLLGAKKIEEHSGARINRRRQWSQREIGKAVAQDVFSDFVEQLCLTIWHGSLFRLEMIVFHIAWITERAVAGRLPDFL